MKLLRRIILVVAVLIIVVGSAIGYILYNWTQGPLPQHAGELQVAGLNDTVEIFRDEWGVPHIYASNAYDLFFAQGYTHAQDRWWQMEFSRHIGAGRIQELTGKTASVMGTDIAIRTMGWYKVAEYEVENVYDEQALTMLEAFADGVNAYILNRPQGQLAFEYNLLGVTGVNIEIKPWTPVDSVVWGKAMAWQLGNNGVETLRSALADYIDVDSELFADLFPDYNYADNPTILLESDLPLNDDTLSRAVSEDILGMWGVDDTIAGNVSLLNDPFLTKREGIGSNNWVAGGDMTESGMPLLANDMHLGLQMPSIWYEIGLHCQPITEECPYNVVGFQFPNVPLVTAGHNDNIAWGFTDHTDDVIDYFLIEINPDNELQYRWNDEWRDITIREEQFNFGDTDEILTIQVRETHLGPIVNDNQLDQDGNVSGFNNENPRVLRWTGLEPTQIFSAVHDLNVATNWEEFRDALTEWAVPAQHVVYADVEGNIGLQVPGLIPIRAGGHTGTLPIIANSDEQDWQGFIPYDELPRVYNPDRNYIQSANQMTSPPAYFDQLAENLSDEYGDDIEVMYQNSWAQGYRGRQIAVLLEELAPHSADTFQQIHGDNYDRSAELVIPLLADTTFDDDQHTSARDWLLDWDYQMDVNSGQAALFAIFWQSLHENIFSDQIGEFIEDNSITFSAYTIVTLTDDPSNIWWDDVNTNEVETMDDILKVSLQEGYDNAVELLGDDEAEWRWGTLHIAEFNSNPLGLSGIEQLENIVNRSIPVSGGPISVNAARGQGDFIVASGVSERVIYDLADWDSSLSVHTTGQSGHPYSPHYDDMLELWSNIQYKPMLWTREKVEEASVSKLTLKP